MDKFVLLGDGIYAVDNIASIHAINEHQVRIHEKQVAYSHGGQSGSYTFYRDELITIEDALALLTAATE